MKARASGVLAVVFSFMVGGGLVVTDVGAGIEDLFNQDLFSTLQARMVDDAQGLIDVYFVERSNFLPILPPRDSEFVQPIAPLHQQRPLAGNQRSDQWVHGPDGRFDDPYA